MDRTWGQVKTLGLAVMQARQTISAMNREPLEFRRKGLFRKFDSFLETFTDSVLIPLVHVGVQADEVRRRLDGRIRDFTSEQAVACAGIVAGFEERTESPHLNPVPTMMGGVGRDGVRAFYQDHLVGKFFQPDVKMTAVSRTVGMKDGKVSHEHIYWDQASVLVQIGLLNPAGLPVVGAEGARKLLSPQLPGRNL